MIDLKRILVPTDLSPCSIAPAVHARQLAAQFGAEVHVLFVLQDPITIVAEPMAVGALPDVVPLRESMRESLKTWTMQHFGEGADTVSIMKRGRDFVEILRYAEEFDIDLIVHPDWNTHFSAAWPNALPAGLAARC